MGLNIVNIFLFGLSFIILAIAAGYATNAAVRLGGKSDPELSSAHRYLTIVAILSWLSVALMLVGIFLFIFFDLETVSITRNFFVYGLLFLTLGLVLTVGILSAIAAYKIGKSQADNSGAYRQAIIAAILGIVGFVLVAVVLGIKIFYKPKKKKEIVRKEEIKESGLEGEGKKEEIEKAEEEEEPESLLPEWFGKALEGDPEVEEAME
jgi:hypothetical protein